MATLPILPCCRRSNLKGVETLVIETSSGQQITLQNSPSSVLIQDGNGNSVRMDPFGIVITTAAKVTINASQVEISAAQLTVNAGMTNFTGVVQANTVMAASIIRGGTAL